MKRIFDISLPISNKLVRWPDSPETKIRRRLDFDKGNKVLNSTVFLDVHTGTHVDAPAHVLQGAEFTDQIDLNNCIGRASLIDLSHIEEQIKPHHLESSNLKPSSGRLLIKTKNSHLWAQDNQEFNKNYIALSPEAAKWIIENNFSLVGIDYLSIQSFDDSSATHLTLLGANVIILEGLNLIDVPEGEYELICLPIKLIGTEGAPARAILRSI